MPAAAEINEPKTGVPVDAQPESVQTWICRRLYCRDYTNTSSTTVSTQSKGDLTMATFISTIRFTDKGIKDIKATCKRAEAFKATGAKMGVEVKNVFWTLGRYDGVLIFDAPDEETATALMLQLGSLGNVHTQTARAYQAAEMEQIIGKLSG